MVDVDLNSIYVYGKQTPPSCVTILLIKLFLSEYVQVELISDFKHVTDHIRSKLAEMGYMKSVIFLIFL